MCTVTFIPVQGKVFITSNRDEKHWRAAATAPALYALKNIECIISKRCQTQVVHGLPFRKMAMRLFFSMGHGKNMIPAPSYRKSRGLILLDLADHASASVDAFLNSGPRKYRTVYRHYLAG